MNWIDRLLQLVLILLLPLAVLGTYMVWDRGEDAHEELRALDAAKLEELVNKVQTQQTAAPQATAKPFYLGKVSYASESAVLSLSGTAPQANATVLVTATVLPRERPVAELDKEPVKGSRVETIPVVPDEKGMFTFNFDVLKEHSEDIIELRLEQDQSIKTIRFDLKEKRQVF